jgi:hypothetical protein
MKRIASISVERILDTLSELERGVVHDEGRANGYEKGEWWYIGVRARAIIHTNDGSGGWLVNTLHTAGLWGLESDSDERYLSAVGDNELDLLADLLRELGFTAEQIATAWAERQHVA